MRARVARRWVSAHSKCEDRYRYNATPSSDRRCRCCALRNIRAPTVSSSFRARGPGRDHDKKEQCNHPDPFEWRLRRALHGPFPACENGLCPADSDFARANRHAGSPTSMSEGAAYLFCSAPAYDVDLTTAVAARQSPELISNKRLPMEEAKMKRSRGVIERFREFLPPCNAIISLGEGNTPLIFAPKLSARVGHDCEVFIKNEGVNPTGSFKDRGMTVAVSRAIDRGNAPDFHLLPVGNAGNITAYWAGYQEYKSHGRSARLPVVIGFQAAGAAPIFHDKIVTKPETIASAIRIGNPASWKEARSALDESKGDVDVVTDQEILAAQSWLACNEGIFVEPASAAPIAGLFKWSRKIPQGRQIVCTVTGHGLKDPDVIQNRIGNLEPVPPKIDNVRRAIGF